MKPQVGIACLVTDAPSGEHLLVGKRGPKSKRGRGLWSVPGGAIEFGESVMDATKRELKEETDLDLVVKESKIVTLWCAGTAGLSTTWRTQGRSGEGLCKNRNL